MWISKSHLSSKTCFFVYSCFRKRCVLFSAYVTFKLHYVWAREKHLPPIDPELTTYRYCVTLTMKTINVKWHSHWFTRGMYGEKMNRKRSKCFPDWHRNIIAKLLYYKTERSCVLELMTHALWAGEEIGSIAVRRKELRILSCLMFRRREKLYHWHARTTFSQWRPLKHPCV